MSAVRLRPMAEADLARGVALLGQLGYEMTEAELRRRVAEVTAASDHALIAADFGGEMAGLMHIFVRPAVENPREAIVQAIVVDAACRRGGVGRALMAAAERWGMEHGCRSVALSSNIKRAPAHAFYAALGYSVSATAYVFRKTL